MEEMLPQLGEEGWELVNVVPESSAWGQNNSGHHRRKVGFQKTGIVLKCMNCIGFKHLTLMRFLGQGTCPLSLVLKSKTMEL